MTDATKEPNSTRIPEFSSYEEEAEFWDTHSFADFWDEFKPIEVKGSPNLTSIFNIRVDELTSQKLRTFAEKKGIGPTTLGRMLIIEGLDRLEQEKKNSLL
jgi:hypothetical protein